MAKEINTAYNPKEVEDKIYKLWENSGLFNPDNLPAGRQDLPARTKKSFTITVPPPNITGSLHMGHALNATIQDILIRKKRMEGYKTLWLPGIDHAGIATQNVVEKELRKQGIRRQDLGREKFVEKIWDWKERYGNIILDQFKKIGSSMDWSRTRFTLDSEYAEAVMAAFIHYHKKGWIYRGERVVNWCSRCETGISDLEVEYREEQAKLYFIKYPIKNTKEFIIVATTRPETMLGDSAVAVNPKDTRYKNLVGKFVLLPIQNREIPIIADRVIDLKFGTGAVKVTPASDIIDFEISLRHNLPKIQIVDEKGIMTESAGPICAGVRAGDCRIKVVEELEKLGLIEKIEDYNHNVAHCDRCGTKIEPRLSKQWFLKMAELAKLAENSVKTKKTNFHPKKWGKLMLDWLKNIRDWNISRQLWWGHRIPVYFCENKPEEYIVSVKKPSKCPICEKCEMKQSEDVLDTWFSSALWPFATLGWPKETADIKNYYPTQVLSTARDIINLWVARMIFSGLELTEKNPFKDVIIHATILTKEGKRMSKSLGTGVDPLNLIEKYGADALRFGLIYQNLGNQDIRFSEDALVTGRKFCNKIWNAARFVISSQNGISNFKFLISKQIPNSKLQTIADKKILKDLEKIQKEVDKDIDKYEFGKALHKLYDFFWHDFCDTYIEKSKAQMADSKQSENTKKILSHILTSSLKLLHPFLPFVTEEIWQSVGNNKSLLIIQNWK